MRPTRFFVVLKNDTDHFDDFWQVKLQLTYAHSNAEKLYISRQRALQKEIILSATLYLGRIQPFYLAYAQFLHEKDVLIGFLW